jgi:hypothetical protein
LLQRSSDPKGPTGEVMVALAAGAAPARDEPGD